MQDEQEADDAIKNLDGFTIKGNRMRVEVSVHISIFFYVIKFTPRMQLQHT